MSTVLTAPAEQVTEELRGAGQPLRDRGFRWLLFAATGLLFWRCQVWFRPLHMHRRMPLLVGWGLVALFIWFAENIGTFARAWTYPSQKDGWHMVGLEKLGSWYLLMIISFVLVSLVQRPTLPDQPKG